MPCFDHDSNSDLLGYMAMAGADPEGARAAFSEFYGRHVDWVHRMVKRLPPNRSISGQDVVDIVQDTFLDAYKGAGTFKPMARASTDCDTERRQARAWLGGIAKNVILQHLAGGILLTDVDDINAISSTTDLSEESALVTATREALDSLEERDNDILLSWLYEYKPGQKNQRMSNAESRALAERWQTSPENIRQRRKRIFDQLRETLQPGQVALEKSR
jgi:RNA polymerase sigma factor (sigma-70 family)